VRYDPAYLMHKALREQRLAALKRKLIISEKGSKGLPCSRRMLVEAEWLLNYTAEWAKLDRQLTAIEHSLGICRFRPRLRRNGDRDGRFECS
jgi:hypothetical protein